MKIIPLTQGQFALVDDTDYESLSQWKWYACKVQSGNFYAVRQSSRKKGKQHNIHMHRQILGLAHGDKRQTDHQNHNTLDNRQDNIRVCTTSQNQMNRKPNQNTASRFKGVTWHKKSRKWNAYIYINGNRKHLGYFETEKEAACAYDQGAKKYFGEFACLNF